MQYYHKVRIMRTENKKVSPHRTAEERAGSRVSEDDYEVPVLVLSNSTTLDSRDFPKFASVGQTVSVAVGSRNQLIAYINHSNGKDGCLKFSTMPVGEWMSFLFFSALIIAPTLGIAYKFSDSQAGLIVALVGVGLLLLLSWGLLIQPKITSRKALAELHKRNR